MAKTVFSNLKILDHTRYLLGGYATQVFADLGAEVIKIEEIKSGDLCRLDFPFINGVSYYFSALNRNKKSVTLNFKSEAGKDAYLRMVKEADVVIENFRPGVMKRLGIGYETEKSVKPDIIHCAMSGFGQEDPRSLKALHDVNFQALSGYLSLNGGKTAPIHLVDVSTSMVAVQSIMAALLQRFATGEGAFCDMRMFDSFVWWNSLLDARYQFDGGHVSADTLEFPALAYNIYETKDGGNISVAMLETKFWADFLASVGLPELLPHKLCRRWEAPEAFEKLEALFRSRTLEEWKEWLGTKDICAMPLLSKGEAIDSIVSGGSGLIAYRDFPLTGRTLQTRIPHVISSLPVSLEDAAPAPRLGEDNVPVLRSVGYSMEEIEAMAAAGACGPLFRE